MVAVALLAAVLAAAQPGVPVVPPPAPSALTGCQLPALSASDQELLARLLVAEVRGMAEPARSRAAAGVLDAVCVRTRDHLLSDGSVYSTLAWHSPGGPWQFPPWVAYGCDGLHDPGACLDGVDVRPYRALVRAWQRGALTSGLSRAWPYYHSIPSWPARECVRDQAGAFICFHEGW